MKQDRIQPYESLITDLEQSKKFNKDKHIPELLNMAESGMTEVQMCRSWHVDKSTWYSWVANNEELRSVISIAKTYFESYWSEYCVGNIDNKKIDKNLWSFLTKESGLLNINRLGIPVDFDGCDEGNVFSYANRVLIQFINGYISSNEAKEFLSVLESFSTLMLNEDQIKELTALRERLQDAIDSVRSNKN